MANDRVFFDLLLDNGQFSVYAIGMIQLATIRRLETLALAGEDHRYWYQWAWSDICTACDMLDVCPYTFADLLAVTSPRVSVTRNVRYALMLTNNPDVKPHDMMRTVWAAYIYWRQTGEIRGPKTGPFALALKQQLSAVPLDVWMARALQVDQKRLAANYVRYPATLRIIKVADKLGWKPAEAQAAIWAGAVREAGRNVPFVSVTDNITLFQGKDR